MKLLYCEDCGDIIAPYRQADRPRWCLCGRHAVWWVDPARGVLRLFDSEPDNLIERGDRLYPKRRPHAWVIGLHNEFLQMPFGHDAESIKTIIDGTPDSYIFKRWGSLVIRIRPGESGDTGWARPPVGPGSSPADPATAPSDS